MPCGGIYPIPQDFVITDKPFSMNSSPTCFQCGSAVDKYDLFVEEWDAYLHYDCLVQFLLSPEGEIVIKHGHSINAYSRDEVKMIDGEFTDESKS